MVECDRSCILVDKSIEPCLPGLSYSRTYIFCVDMCRAICSVRLIFFLIHVKRISRFEKNDTQHMARSSPRFLPAFVTGQCNASAEPPALAHPITITIVIDSCTFPSVNIIHHVFKHSRGDDWHHSSEVLYQLCSNDQTLRVLLNIYTILYH